MKIIIPSLLGVETVISREVQDLGYPKEQIEVRDGLVSLNVEETFEAVSEAVARLNINLRTDERVQLEIDSFDARHLMNFICSSRCAWESWIPDGWLYSPRLFGKSELFGIPACSMQLRKGIVERLASVRGYTSTNTFPKILL